MYSPRRFAPPATCKKKTATSRLLSYSNRLWVPHAVAPDQPMHRPQVAPEATNSHMSDSPRDSMRWATATMRRGQWRRISPSAARGHSQAEHEKEQNGEGLHRDGREGMHPGGAVRATRRSFGDSLKRVHIQSGCAAVAAAKEQRSIIKTLRNRCRHTSRGRAPPPADRVRIAAR
jgi:hypothetical protein